MKAKLGGGGGQEIFFFLEGGNRKFSDVWWGGEQKIFMNLDPIPGGPLVVKNDTSLRRRLKKKTPRLNCSYEVSCEAFC